MGQNKELSGVTGATQSTNLTKNIPGLNGSNPVTAEIQKIENMPAKNCQDREWVRS